MPFSTNAIDSLFDGKAKTYINFAEDSLGILIGIVLKLIPLELM